jgi:hypothetical protein
MMKRIAAIVPRTRKFYEQHESKKHHLPLVQQRCAGRGALLPFDALGRVNKCAMFSSMNRVYIKTYGCQMNEYDSANMADVLRESHGLELISNPEQADVLL